MEAFKKFKEIDSLNSFQEKQRAWLRDYEGLHYGMALDAHEKAGHLWTKSKYKDEIFSPEINKVGRLPNRLVIEFDGDEVEAKKYLDITEEKLKQNQWGYIRSSHNGKSDYLWVEFTDKVKDKQAESFLKWIAPEGSEIDLNFASSKKIFPVLFAVHWKHSYFNEKPIRFNEGSQIDFNSLPLKEKKGTENFDYKTFKALKIFTREGQVEEFKKQQPFFYDRNHLFWLWNHSLKKWDISDEVDILNMIHDQTGQNIISSKERTEIINSLKQEGRKNIPKPIKRTWIQFRDKIFDIETGESIEATPEYWVTNPLSYNVSFNPATPTIDKLFKDWVGEKYVDMLYEIIAYCMLPDYPIHRLFCFIGAGLNGKSCYLRLMKKFIGSDNVTATELDRLLNSHFETAKLYKKLVCQMGETNFNEITQTSILKRLTGQDTIGYEYKNKMPFDDINYAKIIIATNNLPATTDKTIGFYRRWALIDFPNSFNEQIDILNTIPEEEYSNLATRCLTTLKVLLQKREFTNEGSIEERTKRFEDRSNPLGKFITEFTEEDVDGYIFKFDFEKKLNEWCRENKVRQLSDVAVGRRMKELGFYEIRKYTDWLIEGETKQLRAWSGLKWK